MTEDNMDFSNMSMVDLFRIEVENQASVLMNGLLAIETTGGSGECIEPLMRAAHSIKGAARIISLDIIVNISHAMEDLLVAAQNSRMVLESGHVDVLLEGLDLITAISRTIRDESFTPSEEDKEKSEQIVASIKKMLSNDKNIPASSLLVNIKENIDEINLKNAAIEKEPEKKDICQLPVNVKNDEPESIKQLTEESQKFVRVTADSMSLLLGMAGESLVQTKWLQSFTSSMTNIRNAQNKLSRMIEQMGDALSQYDSNKLSNLISEAENRLNNWNKILSEETQAFENAIRRQYTTAERLYYEVLKCRMRPFRDSIQGYPRMIRDIAKNLNKKIKLKITGLDTPVDRDILEKMESPIIHLLRNAADHGIESSEDRQKKGKNVEGTIRLSASHAGGMLCIEIIDDGKGIDIERLKKKITEKKLAPESIVEKMTEEELLEFLFLPGFSTKQDVTEYSGRGVGLDVVRNMIQEVSGIVRIESHIDEGTRFFLLLPLTLSVIKALIVEITGEAYAFPLSRINHCLRISVEHVQSVENRHFINIDNRNIGIVQCSQLLDLPTYATNEKELSIIIIGEGKECYGIQVDCFLGESDIVVRPLDSRLGKVPNISAAAIMENGSPLLILDVEDLIRSTDLLLSTGMPLRVGQAKTRKEQKDKKRVLVVDDSITVREVQRRLLENKGYEVDVAVNGVDGWNSVLSGSYDLVISDVDMPRMSGIDLVKMIKREPSLIHIPVMIVSYKDTEEDRIRGLEAGANYYLTKSSFQDDTLLNAVIDLIGEA